MLAGMEVDVTCPYCNGKLVRVRTESLWEFELWCEPCAKNIDVQSWAHDKEPPALSDVLNGPPTSGAVQRVLF